jgi:hypothetical protein
METTIKASQEKINAAMRAGLGKMEAEINSIWSKFEETIKIQV